MRTLGIHEESVVTGNNGTNLKKLRNAYSNA